VRRLAVLSLLLACAGLSGCAVVIADLNPFDRRPEPLEETVVQGEGDAKIVMLDISRTITAEEEESTFGLRTRDSAVTRVAQSLHQAAEDDDVKALVLRINSPGGTVGASDILYHQIRGFAAKKNVPVVAQFLDLGTSGAYYVALSADEIVAQPTSVTGSIGVILFGLNFEGLMDKIGVRDQTLTAGENKDLGSPFHPLRPEERAILQGVIDSMHTRFIGLVRARRPGVNPDDLKQATDGRIFTAEQALQLGLVDRIGYLDDAIAVARQRAGLTEARVVVYRRPSEFSENIYSTSGAGPAQMNLIHIDLAEALGGGARFMYLWRPGAPSL
jgi:protease-4